MGRSWPVSRGRAESRSRNLHSPQWCEAFLCNPTISRFVRDLVRKLSRSASAKIGQAPAGQILAQPARECGPIHHLILTLSRSDSVGTLIDMFLDPRFDLSPAGMTGSLCRSSSSGWPCHWDLVAPSSWLFERPSRPDQNSQPHQRRIVAIEQQRADAGGGPVRDMRIEDAIRRVSRGREPERAEGSDQAESCCRISHGTYRDRKLEPAELAQFHPPSLVRFTLTYALFLS